MSQSNPENAPQLDSWRGCALVAQQLIAQAQLQGPQVGALNAAIAALLAAERGPLAAQAGLSIFSFGFNDKGALGQNMQTTSQWEPARPVIVPNGLEVSGVAAAASNTALVTKDGQLLLAGANKAYQHADRVPRGRPAPTAIAALAGKRVTRVFMSSLSAHVFACVDGRLMGWGANAKALGLNKRSVSLVPTPVELVGGTPFPGGLPCEQLKAMALGLNHSLMLMHNGTVFVSGLNSRGQLGVGAHRNPYETYTFIPMETPPGMPAVTTVVAALFHSALITEDGGLYMCGQNDDGQLGLPHAQDHFRATRVTAGSIAQKRVRQVATTSTSTLCITEDGQLHGSGNNVGGSLGLGDVKQVSEFVPIPLPEPATRVAAGEHHALVCTASGAVFGWGNNTFGQVTPGQKSRAITTPTKLDFFTGKRAIDVLAGKAHSLVITE